MAQKGYVFKQAGQWYLRYRDNFNVDGKIVRKQKCVQLAEVCDRYRRESDLADLVKEKMDAVSAADKCAKSCEPFSDYVETIWLPHIQSTRKASTHSGYKTYFERYIRPYAQKQGLAVRDFNVRIVSDLLESVAKMYPVNRDSILKIHSVLSGIFRFAMATGAFPGKTATDNPCAGALIPKGKAKQETIVATREQVQGLLKAFEHMPLERAAISLMALAGLRPNEARGLCWTHWDRAQQHLAIQQGVWHTIVGTTKTERSTAFVAVADDLRQILLELWRKQGCPISGFVLAGTRKDKDGKLRSVILDNLAKRSIAETLNRCVTCKKAESAEHKGHDYKRDESLPTWPGWYSLRRFCATQVCVQADSETAASALRNNKEVAKEHYIKPTTVLPKTRRAVNDAMSGLIN
jgi:integrase